MCFVQKACVTSAHACLEFRESGGAGWDKKTSSAGSQVSGYRLTLTVGIVLKYLPNQMLLVPRIRHRRQWPVH